MVSPENASLLVGFAGGLITCVFLVALWLSCHDEKPKEPDFTRILSAIGSVESHVCDVFARVGGFRDAFVEWADEQEDLRKQLADQAASAEAERVQNEALASLNERLSKNVLTIRGDLLKAKRITESLNASLFRRNEELMEASGRAMRLEAELAARNAASKETPVLREALRRAEADLATYRKRYKEEHDLIPG